MRAGILELLDLEAHTHEFDKLGFGFWDLQFGIIICELEKPDAQTVGTL